MIGVLNVFREIAETADDFKFVDDARRAKARKGSREGDTADT